MKRNNLHVLIIIFVVFGAIVVGFLVVTLMGTKTPKKDTRVSTGPEFSLLTNTGVSYKASIVTKTDSGTYNSVFEHTSEGTSRFTTMPNGVLSAQVYSGEVTYSCSATSCEKIKLDDNTGRYAYDYSLAQIKTIKEGAKYVGEQTCPSGTCSVWSWENASGLQTSTEKLFIDATSHRISQVVSTYKQTMTTVNTAYTYAPITISIPPLPSEVPRI